MTDLNRLEEALDYVTNVLAAYRDLVANGERVEAYETRDEGQFAVDVSGPGTYLVILVGRD